MGRPPKDAGSINTTGVDEVNEQFKQSHATSATYNHIGVSGVMSDIPAPKKRPNDDLDLSAFTYKGEFIGEQFKKYTNLVDGEYEEDEAGRDRLVTPGLPIHKTFDFVGYKVVQMRKRLYPKSTDQTTVVVGFRIVQDEPFRETHSTLKNVKQLNDQLHGKLGTQPMIYYLLKKY